MPGSRGSSPHKTASVSIYERTQREIPPRTTLQHLPGMDCWLLRTCNRRTFSRSRRAQGNLDASLANPNDWAIQKFEEQKGAEKYDYVTANTSPKQLILTALWVVAVSSYLYSIFAPYLAAGAPEA